MKIRIKLKSHNGGYVVGDWSYQISLSAGVGWMQAEMRVLLGIVDYAAKLHEHNKRNTI